MALRPTLLIAALLWSSGAQAQIAAKDDPYAYGLRIGIFPAAFQGGISQSHFGSALRGDADLGRGFGVQADGRLSWLNVAGEKSARTFAARAGFVWNFQDEAQEEPLSGNVYAADPPPPGHDTYPSDIELRDMSTSDKLGGPRMQNPDYVGALVATMREVMSIRFGYGVTRSVQTGEFAGTSTFLLNSLHGPYLGFGWGTHWNLSPSATAGQREVGWKRYYVDLTSTIEPLIQRKKLEDSDQTQFDLFPVGVRLGVDGAMAGFWNQAAGVGLAYRLEVGALEGYSGLEGYLFIGLGLELDALTTPGPRR